MQSAWFPYFYTYVLGTVLFVLGMWGARRAGALDLEMPGHRWWIAILILGLLAYAAGHAAFQAIP